MDPLALWKETSTPYINEQFRDTPGDSYFARLTTEPKHDVTFFVTPICSGVGQPPVRPNMCKIPLALIQVLKGYDPPLVFNKTNWMQPQKFTLAGTEDDIMRTTYYRGAIMMGSRSKDTRFVIGPFPISMVIKDNDKGTTLPLSLLGFPSLQKHTRQHWQYAETSFLHRKVVGRGRRRGREGRPQRERRGELRFLLLSWQGTNLLLFVSRWVILWFGCLLPFCLLLGVDVFKTSALANVGRSEDFPYPADIPEGRSQNYDCTLTSIPTGDVTLTFTSLNATLRMVPDVLVFTAADWNETQKVAVAAVDDNVVYPSPHQAMFSMMQKSTDKNFDGIGPDSITVTIEDNDFGTSVLCTRSDCDTW